MALLCKDLTDTILWSMNIWWNWRCCFMQECDKLTASWLHESLTVWRLRLYKDLTELMVMLLAGNRQMMACFKNKILMVDGSVWQRFDEYLMCLDGIKVSIWYLMFDGKWLTFGLYIEIQIIEIWLITFMMFDVVNMLI